MEHISWELALKPGYYTIIVQYTTINVRPGNNRLPRTRPGETPTFRAFPRTSSLARGKHPHTAHFHLARSPNPVGHRVSGTSPKAREIPYTTTMSSLWSYGVFVPKYPARAGVPIRIWGFASTIAIPLSGLCQIWCVACWNRPTNHLISH